MVRTRCLYPVGKINHIQDRYMLTYQNFISFFQESIIELRKIGVPLLPIKNYPKERNMKQITFRSLMMVLALGAGLVSMAKTVKARLFVNGKCEHCKERIEKAALGIKGVSAAVWNVDKKQLLLKYNPEKTDTIAIEKALIAVGHDAGNLKADDAVYNALPECCHYERK